LLERVYGGEFLDHLYYRLANLVLRLPPLRERQADLPALAAWLAEEYGERLDLGKVSLSPAAIDRLCHYLWFGNVAEMEAVIARTLATHRKKIIDAPDLVLDIPGLEEQLLRSPISERRSVSAEKSRKEPTGAPSAEEKKLPGASGFGNRDSPEMKVLISELAHELKNPMVTIKTFAHLLGERFDDAAFRVRFQETVSSDIQRMDDVLEALLDFSRFSQPVVEPIFIYEQLRRVEEELLPDCIKREASLQWGKKGENLAVLADKAQFLYAFKSLLRTVLSQVKPNSEIQIDVEEGGGVAVSYVREGGGLSTFAHYLDLEGEEASPLRILLARILLERNGGGIKISQLDGGRVLIKAELPVV
jgi:signal transduction histidine kinase